MWKGELKVGEIVIYKKAPQKGFGRVAMVIGSKEKPILKLFWFSKAGVSEGSIEAPASKFRRPRVLSNPMKKENGVRPKRHYKRQSKSAYCYVLLDADGNTSFSEMYAKQDRMNEALLAIRLAPLEQAYGCRITPLTKLQPKDYVLVPYK